MIGEKIIKIMSEIKPVERTEENDNGSYKTVKVEKIIEMVQPLLIKNKVIVVPRSVSNFSSQGNRVYMTMKYEFIDVESNEKDSITVEVPGSGFDETGGRAVFAALTGAYRYALQQTFAIAIIDEIKNDGDNNSIEGNVESKQENNEITTNRIQNNKEDFNLESMSIDRLDSLFSAQTI